MSIVDEMVKANVGTAQKNDPPVAPVAPYNHGSGGLFNRRDRSNPVMSTIMGPLGGVANAIPVYNGASDLSNAYGGTDFVFDTILTGQTEGDLDDFDNQSTEVCDYGPVGGLKKLCTIINSYGNYKMSTREVEIDRAGRVNDMVDANRVQVMNDMPANVFATPSEVPSLTNAVNNEIAERIFEMALSFARMFYRRTFIGTPANNQGERRDIVGLDTLINAGNKRDATFNTICTAADSDIKNFQSNIVSNPSGPNLMQYIEQCDRFSTWRASRQGLGIPTYIIAMRPELFQELCYTVPIQKYQQVIAMANAVTNGRAIINMSDAYNDRNAMMANPFLPVNGRMIPVVLDDTIAETSTKPGGVPTHASTIYGIPMTVLGGMPVTFWQYWNHSNAQSNAIQQRANGFTWTTDGGIFRWEMDYARGCMKMTVKFKPMLRMRTTQLAWRIDNVACQPLQHLTSYDPNSAYFVNGGVPTGGEPLYYSSWSPSAPAGP